MQTIHSHRRQSNRLKGFILATLMAPLSLYAADGGTPSSFSLDAFESNISRGGPPKDGIPSIDNPQFIDASEADAFLEADDVVFGVVRNGEARAYPQRILVWHEIVNDQIGGENVAVTYCPLTGTAMGFERGDTTLGVSGRLVNSNLIMYDRETESYFPQILGTAINGPRKGERLDSFPVTWTSWEQWREAHPDTEVMSRNTGHARNYSRDPYGSYGPRGGYYAEGSQLMFPVMNSDDRLDHKAIVVTALTEDGPLAVAKSKLREAGNLRVSVGDGQYLAVHDESLDAGRIYRIPQDANIGDGPVELAANGPRQAGQPLDVERVVAWDAFWFAWAAFYPETAFHG